MPIYLLDHTQPALGNATAWANEFAVKGVPITVLDLVRPDNPFAPRLPAPVAIAQHGERLVVFLHSCAATRNSWIEKFTLDYPEVTGIEDASALLFLITAGGQPEAELPECCGNHGIYRLTWTPATFATDPSANDFIKQILAFARA